MIKKILKTQTILALICFLIMTPFVSTFAAREYDVPLPPLPGEESIGAPQNEGILPSLLLDPNAINNTTIVPGTEVPTLEEPPTLEFDPRFTGKYYDPITDTYWDSEDDFLLNPYAVCTPGDTTCEENAPYTQPAEADAVRAEYNAARARAGQGQGGAFAGGPGGAATGSSTTNSQGGTTLSAASCIGSQLLGNLLASTISSAIGSIVNLVTDTVLGVAGAIISVPTNELGSVKYDTKRAKEQIQLSNAAEKGMSVGFGGINALIGVSWDSIAYCIVNSMIDYIARSTIQWAQSGFKGNPSFIQNPGQFFKQLADTEASTFLQSLAYGTIGRNICQPFRAQLVLNIARNYTGGAGGPTQVTGGGPSNGYTTGGFNGATLPSARVGTGQTPGNLGTTRPTTIGANGAGGNTLAAKSANTTYGGCSLDQINANLKGFLKGNFSQGGWNSWLQLTQVASNNPYSTYITLSGQLQGAVQQKKDLASIELNWGRGFLSFRKCDEKTAVKDQSKCPITTPGNLIQGQLEKTLGIPKDRLVLAQKFDQVIAVIVDQLISTALNKMLE